MTAVGEVQTMARRPMSDDFGVIMRLLNGMTLEELGAAAKGIDPPPAYQDPPPMEMATIAYAAHRVVELFKDRLSECPIDLASLLGDAKMSLPHPWAVSWLAREVEGVAEEAGDVADLFTLAAVLLVVQASRDWELAQEMIDMIETCPA